MVGACRNVAAAIFPTDHHQRIRGAESRRSAAEPASLAVLRHRVCRTPLLGLDPLGVHAGLWLAGRSVGPDRHRRPERLAWPTAGSCRTRPDRFTATVA